MLVIRARISPEYVLDHITWREVNSLLEEVEISSRDGWEQTRMIMWSIIQSQSSKRIEIKEILPFDWDKKDKASIAVTKEDVEAFKIRNNIK